LPAANKHEAIDVRFGNVITPLNRFRSMFKLLRFVSSANSVGTVPNNELSLRASSRKAVKRPISVGSVELNLASLKNACCSPVSSPISVTSFPPPTQLGTPRKVRAVSTPIIVDSGPPPGPWQPATSRRVTFPEGEQSNQAEFGHA
jgi:hypothetical protein